MVLRSIEIVIEEDGMPASPTAKEIKDTMLSVWTEIFGEEAAMALLGLVAIQFELELEQFFKGKTAEDFL